MKLAKPLLVGALLTLAVAALAAQDDLTPEESPDGRKAANTLATTAVALDQKQITKIVALQKRQAMVLKSILRRMFEKQARLGNLSIEDDRRTNAVVISGLRDLVDRAVEAAGVIDQFKFTPGPQEGPDGDRQLIARGVTPVRIATNSLFQSLQELDPQGQVSITMNGAQLQFAGDAKHVNELVDLADRLDGLGTDRLLLSVSESGLLESLGRPVRSLENGLSSDTAAGAPRQLPPVMQGPPDLALQFRSADQETVELARQIRDMAEREPANPQIETLRQSLVNAVAVAFDLRQRAQQEEAARLQERLKRLEGAIAGRKKARNEIIERRVAELIDPEQSWADGIPDPNSFVPVARGTEINRQTGSVMRMPPPTVVEMPLGAFRETSSANERLTPGTSSASLPEDGKEGYRDVTATGSTATDNEARFLIEATAAIVKARGAADEYDSKLVSARNKVQRILKLHEAGQIPTHELDQANEELGAVEAGSRRAHVDLKAAIRQERQMRLALETRIKLLQLDVQSAKLSLTQANHALSRAKALLERSAITQNEFEERQTAVGHSELALAKAETLLSAAQQALKAADEEGQSDSTEAASPELDAPNSTLPEGPAPAATRN